MVAGAQEVTFEVDGLHYQLQSDQTLMLVKAEVGIYPDSLAIPAIVQGYPVTKIRSYAFNKHASLRHVVLPDGLIEIGNYAFSGTSLQELRLPGTVRRVGWGAFLNSPIESVYVEEGDDDLIFCSETYTSSSNITYPFGEYNPNTYTYRISIDEVYLGRNVKNEHTYFGKSESDYGVYLKKGDTYAMGCTVKTLVCGEKLDSVYNFAAKTFLHNKLTRCLLPNALIYDEMDKIVTVDNITYAIDPKTGVCQVIDFVNLWRPEVNYEVIVADSVAFGGKYYYPDTLATSITRYANIKSLTLSKSITEIPRALFQEHGSIERVITQGTIRRIGNHAFYNCPKLSKLRIGTPTLWNISAIRHFIWPYCCRAPSILFRQT